MPLWLDGRWVWSSGAAMDATAPVEADLKLVREGGSIPPGTDRENDGHPRHLTEVNYIRNSDTDS